MSKTRAATRWRSLASTRHIVLLLICSIYFIVYMDRVNLATAAGNVRDELGLSNTQLGLVFSAYAYPYAALQLFGGGLADRLGPRLTLGVFGSIFALATVFTGLVGGLASLIVVRAFVGLGEGPALAAATRAIADWMPKERWSFAQGLTHAFSRIGNAVTAPFVAFLIVAINWRGAFFVIGALSLAWVALWVWYFRDDPRRHSGSTEAELAELVPRPVNRPQVPYRRLFRRMLPVILVDFCYGWTLFVVLNWLPSFFRGAFGLDLGRSALFTAGIFLGGILGDTLGGILSDRILVRTGSVVRARRDLIAGGLIASAICFSPILLSHDFAIVTGALVLGFFCMELVIAPLWSVPMDITPEFSGTASGFMNFGAASAGIISPWAFGWIVDLTGNWNLPFAFTVGLMLCGAFGTRFMHPERPFSAPNQQV
jgi:MFS family permease